MCTAIVLYKQVRDYPIVVAGNRDEFLTRRSMSPHLWEGNSHGPTTRIFSGKDLEAGGTWFGVNQYGLVVGLTNRYTGERDSNKLSRGNLVLQCLNQSTPEKAREALLVEEPSAYNPFNLFCLDQNAGFLFTNYPRPCMVAPLEPGIHLLTNHEIGDPDDPKAGWIHEKLANLQGHPGPLEDRLKQVLRHHGKEDASAPLCVHLPGYGTVSSSLLLLANPLTESRFTFAEGPPCEEPYEDLSLGMRGLFNQ